MVTQSSLLLPNADFGQKEVVLWEEQVSATQELLGGMSAGKRKQILCLPTGAGKTIIATYMMQSAMRKGKRSLFLVDRLALIDQVHAVLTDYGIPCQRIAGGVLYGASSLITVAMMQTVEKQNRNGRNRWQWYWDSADLLIVDECHTMRDKVLEQVRNHKGFTVGLTATPFSEGLGNTYEDVVAGATTNELIERGRIVRPEVYLAEEIDMRGAKTNNKGEWLKREVEVRSSSIVGDIVQTWEEKTYKYYGGPAKTLVFAANVAHGEQLCAAFQARGYDFRNSSYRLPSDQTRELVEQFRNDEFIGLASVEQFVKGFDVPNVQCMIGARPYRKSFSAHIQQLGRVMRSAPDKEFGLVLDHAGNFAGFYDETIALFEQGPNALLGGGLLKYKERTRKEREERKDVVCERCGFLLMPKDDVCPSCGMRRKRRKQKVEAKPGVMRRLPLNRRMELRQKYGSEERRRYVWQQMLNYASALTVASPDPRATQKLAMRHYNSFYGEWPQPEWGQESNPTGTVDSDVREIVRSQLNQQWERYGWRNTNRR